MIDVTKQIEAVQRELGSGTLAAGEARAIRLRRMYDAPIEDIWDALTDPERIGRWFLPISGDYRIGGHYQFEGNAGGEIVACERPHRLRATWVYGEPASPADISEVELRLTPSGADSTTLELEHTAIVPDEFWTMYGPGAVGVGWEGGLLGLALHLTGGSIDDPIAWQSSDEGRDFNTRSSQAWGVASTVAGEDPAAVATMVANTTQFYAPDPEAPS
jgi:uncharacterized protein YndB with AHSA1/START domain